jgi:hypothetical protein
MGAHVNPETFDLETVNLRLAPAPPKKQAKKPKL